ncbi:hypothetical protein SAMN04489761_4296 [Tenacibaculum sp. MAR_2009_124]|uniref:hypothetical protein n=1 Tax=Tenacibaculum sp. MAR_2009_124 TaxID=1250059 RepID=UPI000896669C|nr:hypothetical protein [Tenacibaculum sp. MAR_2009_124]SED10706.1 hypothetical protein SAMN04489761_4296 [Tenacibaculum sp. MAR_2009_124]
MHKERITYILIIIILVFFLYKKRIGNYNSSSSNLVSVDSSLVIKRIPVKSNSFKIDKPREIIKYKYVSNDKKYKKMLNELEEKHDQKVDSVILLRELLQAMQLREYEEVISDSLLTATFLVKTKGSLESIDFSYKTFPQEVKYYEKTIRVKPKYSILAGTSIITSELLNKASIELNAGFQNRNGNMLELGINSNKGFRVGYKWNLFTKY